MKLGKNKLSIDPLFINPMLLSMATFLISFLIQMLFVFKWDFFRYPSEEFSIMAMGANCSGYSWNHLCDSAPAGGVFFIPLFKLLFRLGISGTAVYRIIRWLMAAINAVPAYIASQIAAKHFKLSTTASVSLGLIATLMSVSRASSVRPESILVVLTWVLLYALICYSKSDSLRSRTIYSCVAGLLFAFMLFANVKAVVLLPAFIIAFVVVLVAKKKWMVNIWVFIPSFLLCAGLFNYIFDRVLISYSTGYEWETSWTREMQEYLYSIVRGIQRLHMSHGIRGFFDLFASNIWMIAVFSIGIVIYAFILTVYRIHKKDEQIDFETAILFFLGVGILLAILALSFIEIRTGIFIHSRDGSPNNSMFSLSTYGYLVCPMFVIELMALLKCRKDSSRSLEASMIIILYSAVTLILSVIIPAVRDGNVSMKWWFGYETSFLVMLNQWADRETSIWFFIFPTVIVLFMMWCYHKSKDFKTAVTLILLVSIVQYNYIEGDWINQTEYRERFDALVDYINNSSLSRIDITDIYWDGDGNTAYALQLALPELSVHTEVPDKYAHDVVILTSGRPSDVCLSYNLGSNYNAVSLDDNETLVTNDQDVINCLSDSLLVYDADSLAFDFVTFTYQNVLGRGPDYSGLQAWGELLIRGDIEPSDLIVGLLTSDEVETMNYSSEQMATIMVYAFLYYPSNSEIIPPIAARLDKGETVREVAADLINSDRYSEVLSTFRLRDSNSDRVNCIVRRAYDCILERSADEYGLVEFGNMIRDREITPDDLVEMLLNSAEYQENNRSTEYTIIRLYVFYNNKLPDMQMVRRYAVAVDSGEMTFRDLQQLWSGSMTYHSLIMDYNMEEYI